MKMTWPRHFFCMAALLMVWSCQTDVELCNETVHPHRAKLTYSFNWGKNKNSFTPDSMTVLASRVVNIWKTGMATGSFSSGGTYLFNAPLDYRPGTENVASATLEPVTWKVKQFKVPVGDYKFIAFNMGAEEFDYSNVFEFFANPDMLQSELSIAYRTYCRSDSGLHSVIPSWRDYNAYSNYVQTSSHAFYYDTLSTMKLSNSQNYNIQFSPKELTQCVDIYFDIAKVIDKQVFTVDSVFGEISGLPGSINLATGILNVEKTYKMMFPTDKIKDTETAKTVACHAEIHVSGIMRNRMRNIYFGPGIMQVVIYCSAYSPETGQRETKRIQGKINLYNTLTKTPSLRLNDDQKSAKMTTRTLKLSIGSKMEIDGEKILGASDESRTDVWKDAKEETNIIDM